jgi:hypothetical protein
LTGSRYFRLTEVSEVDKLWYQLKDKTTAVYPVENFDYGMRAPPAKPQQARTMQSQ